MPSDLLPEPWRSFLRDLDTQLVGPTELHCFGGFVVAQCYGLMRPTADIDILESKGTDLITIAKLAGRTSPLYKRRLVALQAIRLEHVSTPTRQDDDVTVAALKWDPFEKARLLEMAKALPCRSTFPLTFEPITQIGVDEPKRSDGGERLALLSVQLIGSLPISHELAVRATR
jgi:hypothetical protein